jgi:hypothetical protein
MNLEATRTRLLNKTTRPANEPRSPWEEQLELFKAKLNSVPSKYPPYTHARIAKLLKNAGKNDAATAYAFYRKLEEEATNFGALFTALTKSKKV